MKGTEITGPHRPIPPSKTCNAKNRQGNPCKKPAGWGTYHTGTGRCKLHGGSTPVKHGLYSKYFRPLSDAIEKDDPRLTDIREQILLQHALLVDLLERARGGDGIDPDAILRVSQTIVISIDRLIRIEHTRERMIEARDKAMSRDRDNVEKEIEELMRSLFLEPVIELAREYIDDPEKADEYIRRVEELLRLSPEKKLPSVVVTWDD